ncbi:unnamed protein product [Trichogramma brassicae]|uniref:DJ-1/PfpI domain-containing protein n=1 Tax=Trichogramma brassicae TaxID=86971 RepID=A0A6H5HYT0_9HYME|nr:unnamed protein product [Trichogramma brassicae]
MKFFDEHELFKKSSTKVEECWYDDDDEVFASEAKKITITSGTSLYDVLKLRPEEEDKLLAYTDYYEFAHHYMVWKPNEPHCRTCIWHLCEKMSRGFFRRWAQDAFWELIQKRLPTECCEKIFDDLTNEDLYRICLAAADEQSSPIHPEECVTCTAPFISRFLSSCFQILSGFGDAKGSSTLETVSLIIHLHRQGIYAACFAPTLPIKREWLFHNECLKSERLRIRRPNIECARMVFNHSITELPNLEDHTPYKALIIPGGAGVAFVL